jgi:hypothetical protein
LDEHNHALAALRYLISRLDARRRPAAAAPPMNSTPADGPRHEHWIPLR